LEPVIRDLTASVRSGKRRSIVIAQCMRSEDTDGRAPWNLAIRDSRQAWWFRQTRPARFSCIRIFGNDSQPSGV